MKITSVILACMALMGCDWDAPANHRRDKQVAYCKQHGLENITIGHSDWSGITVTCTHKDAK